MFLLVTAGLFCTAALPARCSRCCSSSSSSRKLAPLWPSITRSVWDLTGTHQEVFQRSSALVTISRSLHELHHVEFVSRTGKTELRAKSFTEVCFQLSVCVRVATGSVVLNSSFLHFSPEELWAHMFPFTLKGERCEDWHSHILFLLDFI